MITKMHHRVILELFVYLIHCVYVVHIVIGIPDYISSILGNSDIFEVIPQTVKNID